MQQRKRLAAFCVTARAEKKENSITSADVDMEAKNDELIFVKAIHTRNTWRENRFGHCEYSGQNLGISSSWLWHFIRKNFDEVQEAHDYIKGKQFHRV